MPLAPILLVGAGAWGLVLLLAISLCKTAKAGDIALRAAYRSVERDARPDPHQSPVFPDPAGAMAAGQRGT